MIYTEQNVLKINNYIIGLGDNLESRLGFSI